MSYRNETYVCFDADSDIHYYRLMTAWKEHDHIAFNFHNAHEINTLRTFSLEATIKAKLRERLANTKVLIVLIGKNTASLYKYVRWEIRYAIEYNIPIIAVNLNGNRRQDALCPPIMRQVLALYIPFNQKMIDYALNHWPSDHHKRKTLSQIGPFYYNEILYTGL